VVFYCHFPDKLLANGAFVEGNLVKRKTNFLKWLYRQPMDWLEEVTTSKLFLLIYDKWMANLSFYRTGGRDSCQLEIYGTGFQIVLSFNITKSLRYLSWNQHIRL
jgi:hypothetical protein